MNDNFQWILKMLRVYEALAPKSIRAICIRELDDVLTNYSFCTLDVFVVMLTQSAGEVNTNEGILFCRLCFISYRPLTRPPYKYEQIH